MDQKEVDTRINGTVKFPERCNRLVYIDIDGTLTDGKLYIDSDGEKLFKAFNTRDVRAIRELIYNGFEVILVSADDHPSGVHFAKKVGADFVCLRNKAELPPAFIAIGDDSWDLQMLRQAEHAFCPLNAANAIQLELNKTGGMLLQFGGDGVVAELIDVLKERGIL